MLKSQQVIVLGFLVTLGFLYNNCSSKVQFSTAPPTVSAFNNVPNQPAPTVPPVLPPSSVLTFNDLNQPATIAFNDNYPAAGDSDYNDFVVNLSVTETYDSNGALNKIVVKYSPKTKISSADHVFALVFDGHVRGRNGVKSNLHGFVSKMMFEGPAEIDYSLVDGNGTIVTTELNHDKLADLVVFPSTSNAMSRAQVATITISKLNGDLNRFVDRGSLSIKRYRSVLFNGSNDIDISDIDPAFVDNGGAPVGFFVPVDWRPPAEGQSIFPAYPEFRAHSDYVMSGQSLDAEPQETSKWFNAVGNPSLLVPAPTLTVK